MAEYRAYHTLSTKQHAIAYPEHCSRVPFRYSTVHVVPRVILARPLGLRLRRPLHIRPNECDAGWMTGLIHARNHTQTSGTLGPLGECEYL